MKEVIVLNTKAYTPQGVTENVVSQKYVKSELCK